MEERYIHILFHMETLKMFFFIAVSWHKTQRILEYLKNILYKLTLNYIHELKLELKKE